MTGDPWVVALMMMRMLVPGCQAVKHCYVQCRHAMGGSEADVGPSTYVARLICCLCALQCRAVPNYTADRHIATAALADGSRVSLIQKWSQWRQQQIKDHPERCRRSWSASSS
jgi:hypothetical protein